MTAHTEVERAEDQFVTVQGVRTRYRAQGQGRVMLLLHGLGRSLEDWEDVMGELARDHHVIALDLIGSGYSDKPDVPYSIPGLARFVVAFMDAIHVPRATVIGNSLGGAVALHLAVQANERVEALVLVSPVGFGTQITPLLRLASVPKLGEWFTAPNPLDAKITLYSIMHDRRGITAERLKREAELSRLPGAQKTFLQLTRMLTGPRGVHAQWRSALLPRLKDLDLPVLVVWGRQDRIVPSQQLRALQQHLPRAQVRLLDRCGHCPQFERPGEFSQAVRDFLQPQQAISS